MDWILQPWHWAFSGFMIVVVMFLLIFLGQKFGVSTAFQAFCSAAGGGKFADYFDYNWKKHSWLFMFVIGSVIGGAIASSVLNHPETMKLSEATISDLESLGISGPSGEHAQSLLPTDLFSMSELSTPKGIILFILGGFLIGFGTRYAGGCTSGHAIMGLSDLQLPSLVSVIGFFIGGLAVTHFILPLILGL